MSRPTNRDTLIIDLGSYSVKSGLAGAALAADSDPDAEQVTTDCAHGTTTSSTAAAARPPFCIPSIAGREPLSSGLFGAVTADGHGGDEWGGTGKQRGERGRVGDLYEGDSDGLYVGLDASPERCSGGSHRARLLRLSRPIQNGIVQDSEAGYRLLKQSVNVALIPEYYRLKTASPQDYRQRDDGSTPKGTRALADQLEEHAKAVESEANRLSLLRQFESIGNLRSRNGGQSENCKSPGLGGATGWDAHACGRLFGSYRAACADYGAQRDGVLAYYPQMRATRQSLHASLIEPPFASRRQRAQLAELLFESNYGSSAGDSHVVGRNSAGSRDGSDSGESSEASAIDGLFCGVSPLLSLYSTGKTTGVVLDVGHQIVSTAAAINGHALTSAMQRCDGVCGGEAVTEHLRTLLQLYRVDSPHPLSSTGRRQWSSGAPLIGSGSHAEKELIGRMKERCCSVLPYELVHAPLSSSLASPSAGGRSDGGSSFIAQSHRKRRDALLRLDLAMKNGLQDQHALLLHWQKRRQGQPDLNNSNNNDSTGGAAALSPLLYPLPDGNVIAVAAEAALQAAEVHFTPAIAGYGEEAVSVVDILQHTLCHASLRDHGSVRSLLLANVVLSGGAAAMDGFHSRLLEELRAQTPVGLRVQVSSSAPAERERAAWLGAAFLAQLSTFDSALCVSRAAFFDEGEAALHARLFA